VGSRDRRCICRGFHRDDDVTAIAIPEFSTEPTKLELRPNYPNPFNPSTRISFTVPAHSHLILRVYDVGGRLVKTLIDRKQVAALVETSWDGTNAEGRFVGMGVYFARLQVEGTVLSQKMVLIK
jgi:hypothetical protein